MSDFLQSSKLLILDLDETLVFATENRLNLVEDFRAGDYFVYKRPGLAEFIRFAADHFRVAVWTASTAAYADAIIQHVFKDGDLEFAWTRERCTIHLDPEQRIRHWVKDLKKVRRRGYSLNDVLIIDDTPSNLERNYGNHIRVTPFFGDPSDRELEGLRRYLLDLKDKPNVRSVEKRFWRKVYQGT